MDSLANIISDIRNFMYGGMVTLPLTLAGTMLLLGLFTANYAMLFFLLGYLIAAPLGTGFINLICRSTYLSTKDVCKVDPHSPVTSAEGQPFSSPWWGMISFFIGYLGMNSVQLLVRDTGVSTSLTVTNTDKPDYTKVSNRKSQAFFSLFSIAVFLCIVFYFRIQTGCENIWGMFITLLLLGAAGVGWYTLLSTVGEDRLSDLFGIANRLLPPSAIENKPIACVPVAV